MNMHRGHQLPRLLGALGGLALTAVASVANALVITPAGQSLGFSTAPIVTGMPFDGLGPIGTTVLPDGNILTVDVANGDNYVFKDQDNQAFSAALPLFTTPGMDCCGAYATSNGWAWGGQNGLLTRFNNDGTIAQTYNIRVSNGVWTNPVNGNLLIANGDIKNVDVSDINNPTLVSEFGSQGDGLVVSPDGQIVYTSSIVGFDIQTGVQVFNHFVNGGDGMGIIISNNSLNGKLIANTNLGTVLLIDPTGVDPDVIIADQGARGDYTTPDPTDGSLILTQGADLWRLSCGQGCGISVAPPPTNVPEPATLALMGASLGVMAASRRRRAAAKV